MLPEPLRDFLTITMLDVGAPFFGELFQRKFAQTIPDFPNHLGVFYRTDAGHFLPLTYLHYVVFGDIVLVGGGCTDGRVYAQLNEQQRQLLSASGGPLLHGLRYGFAHFADRCDAFFGYCGDKRALEVDLQAGFEQTEHPYLLVHWPREPDPMRRRSLMAKAHAIGPF